MNKSAEKQIISLNSVNNNTWKLFFGVQDKNAPNSPEELEKAGLNEIPAVVPGNIEIDLEREGLISNPMIGDNIYKLRKYETFHWWFTREFNKPVTRESQRVELCFDGIDCFADIWLNGKLIASVENMLVEHHFDITGYLNDINTLHVHIKSTELIARNYVRNHWGIRNDQLSESVSIRKAAHMFGWDIMPRLLSAGIWKDVKLEIINPTFFSSVYWVTKHVDTESKSANLYVDWQFHTDRLNIDDLKLNFEIEKNGQTIFHKTIPVITTIGRENINNLNDIEFWWPRGFGNQPLYNAHITVYDDENYVLAVNSQRIGIRKAELIYTPINTEEHPGDFHFKVNGEKVFAKGTNWVPLDALHSRDIKHLETAFAMLLDLNCNMVRMWGGNVYENDEFYNLCDENGIMVWQDFSMGCTIYPQEMGFQQKIRIEAGKIIRRLRHHPSLVLWAGNNENDVSLSWGEAQDHINPNSDVLSREILPRAVKEWDPETPYLPSSPFISEEAFQTHKKVVEELSPERHLWGPRGFYKAPYYTGQNAKFVSEIGYHGCPNVASLKEMMTAEYVYPWNVKNILASKLKNSKLNRNELIGLFEWNREWQCKATNSHPNSDWQKHRNSLMLNQIFEVFGEIPLDLEDFVLASQVVQAEAMKFFVELWRMDKDKRNGILWWNLRDGWPIISDAIVDYYGGKKLAYSYIKNVQRDVCVMIGDNTPEGHPVTVVNDTREKQEIEVLVKDADSGKVLLNEKTYIVENGKQTLNYLSKTEGNALWLIEYTVNGEKFKNHYLAYQPHISFKQYKEWLTKLNPAN
jgi:beta-mannosidase